MSPTDTQVAALTSAESQMLALAREAGTTDGAVAIAVRILLEVGSRVVPSAVDVPAGVIGSHPYRAELYPAHHAVVRQVQIEAKRAHEALPDVPELEN